MMSPHSKAFEKLIAFAVTSTRLCSCVTILTSFKSKSLRQIFMTDRPAICRSSGKTSATQTLFELAQRDDAGDVRFTPESVH